MNAAKSFAPVPVPDAIARMAAAAPGGAAVVQQPEQQPEQPQQPAAESAVIEQPAAEAAPAVAPGTPFKLPVKDATQTMSLKMPKALYDELRNFKKLTDIDMSVVLVDGARKELARLKKHYGLEG
jgi:hypothetical protein